MIKETIMKRSTNTGLKGITRRNRRNQEKFEAYFAFKGVKQHIGTFNSLKEATSARTSFIKDLI